MINLFSCQHKQDHDTSKTSKFLVNSKCLNIKNIITIIKYEGIVRPEMDKKKKNCIYRSLQIKLKKNDFH